MEKQTQDLVIIGGGIMGLSTAYTASHFTNNIILLEKSRIGNPKTASFGYTRSIRNDYLDPFYARLAYEARRLWLELERKATEPLIIQCGCLNIAKESVTPDLAATYAEQSYCTLTSLHLHAEAFTRDTLQQRFPQFAVDMARLDVEAGFLYLPAVTKERLIMHATFLHDSPAIRFATFLAPNLYCTYKHIARYVGVKVGYPTSLSVGHSFEDFVTGQVDVGFICGLPYVHLVDSPGSPVELLAAPVLRGERYQNKPVYFSDVIVRDDSPFTSFDDLGGCRWAYNQRTSHSGYNLVCSSLLEQGKTLRYFSTMMETGSHQRSLQVVLERQADAAAIDSHVLDALLWQNKELELQVRVIATLGPSSTPPIVVVRSLDSNLKCWLQEALITMHNDPGAADGLHEGRIDHFVAVTDTDYDDIRTIFARVQAAMKA